MKIIPLGRIVRTAARGEAVDFDKYDKDGRPNPYHGWTLDFPEHVPTSDRTYSNKDSAQGWYDDPENEPLAAGSRWGGSGDYADRAFHNHTQNYNQALDPNREVIDSSGALGHYDIGGADLNEYHERGHHLRPGNQTGYPEGFSDSPGADQRGVYSTRPDLNPWPGMERSQDNVMADALSTPGRRYHMPTDDSDHASNTGRVFGLWHGGSSYSHSDPTEDMESFPSLDHARRAVEGRYGNYDSHHGGERTTYDPTTGTHHLTGDTHGANLETPAVGRDSSMDIYQATPHESGGWSVHTDGEPQHHIWLNGDGDAVVGRERGDYGDDDDHDEYGDNEDQDDEEEQGSHPKQQHLINAGFEHHPHEYNGDRYVHEDHNGHIHTVRAPNPRYGGMDNWHYEFHPHNEQDRDPNAPRNAAIDGPRSLTFQANDPEEAYNLHQNMGNDLSELASRGWGTHSVKMGPAGIMGDPRGDNRATGVSNHTIEGHRRDANDSGYDRIIKTPHGTWAAHHVPHPTSINRTPPVSVIAEGRSRRDVLDAADHHDARAYLTSRAADRGSYVQDEGSGVTTWHIPGEYHPADDFTVRSPGEGAHNPRWVVEHRNNGRTVTHTSHPNWINARDEMMGRI
jgi:hypothetical protein